jgi:hypothetical protein
MKEQAISLICYKDLKEIRIPEVQYLAFVCEQNKTKDQDKKDKKVRNCWKDNWFWRIQQGTFIWINRK